MIDVEATRPDDAMTIADEIVAPVRAQYAEVLIYVRGVGAPAGAGVHRIQWTPRGGFVHSQF